MAPEWGRQPWPHHSESDLIRPNLHPSHTIQTQGICSHANTSSQCHNGLHLHAATRVTDQWLETGTGRCLPHAAHINVMSSPVVLFLPPLATSRLERAQPQGNSRTRPDNQRPNLSGPALPPLNLIPLKNWLTKMLFSRPRTQYSINLLNRTAISIVIVFSGRKR